MFFLIAQDTATATAPLIPNGPAWAVGVCAILGTLTYMLSTILQARWGAGSKAKIDEMNAEAALKKAENEEKVTAMKLAQLDADDITEAYEGKLKETIEEYKTKLKELDTNSQIQMKGLQAHIDIIDKKLDASESRERNCVAELNLLKGRLQIIEDLKGIKEQIDDNRQKIKDLQQNGNGGNGGGAAAVAPIVQAGATGTVKDPETKEITGEIKMDQ